MREFEPYMMSHVDLFPLQLLRSRQQDKIVEMTSQCRWLAIQEDIRKSEIRSEAASATT